MEAAIGQAEAIAELKALLRDVLDMEQDFPDTAHFMTDLGLSSLMALEVMVALEKRYGVKFAEQDVKQLTSVQNVYQALREKNAHFG